jgi:hypothetical protein
MKDFLRPQPSDFERLAYETELKLANMARQVRSICIALKLKESDFVDAFNDQIKQEVYIKNTGLYQDKLAAKEKEKQEALKKLEVPKT